MPAKLVSPTCVMRPRHTSPLGRYSSWSDVASRALRRDEQVRADEELLRRLRPADERHDLLEVGPVSDHLAGQLLGDVRRVPRQRALLQRTEEQDRQRDDADRAGAERCAAGEALPPAMRQTRSATTVAMEAP